MRGAGCVKTIVAIDAERSLPDRFIESANQLGFRVLSHATVAEARASLAETPPEILFLEPLVEGGWELLAAHAGRSATEFVVVTSAPRTAETYARALELGAREFLCKPATPAQLLECLLASTARADESPEAIADRDRAIAVEPATELALAELLSRHHHEGATGTLQIESSGQRIGVQFRNGSIVARSRERLEPLEDFLLRGGYIRESARERLREILGDEDANVPEAVVDLGILTQSKLEQAIQERAEEPIWVALQWRTGRCSFAPGTSLDPRMSEEVHRETSALIFESVQRAPESSGRRKWIRENRDRFVIPASRGRRFGAGLDKERARLMEQALTHERTVGEIVASQDLGEQELYGLVLAGWVELLTEIEVDAETMVDTEVPHHKASGASPIDELLASMPLSTASTATRTKKEVVEQALASMKRRSEAPPRRGLEAEEWFRKGKVALSGGRLADAVEAFGMAAHLDPDEGEYLAHLGFSLLSANPSDVTVEREALEHIARGIRLSPSREMPYVLLGRIFKAKNDVETAARFFRRALKVRPDCHAARQELRLIEIRKKRKATLFG